MSNAELVNVTRAAEILGVSASFLNKARVYGTGPDFIKLGASVKYSVADLQGWAAARRCRSTSDYGKATSGEAA